MTLELDLIYIQQVFGDDPELAMSLMLLALEANSVEVEQAELVEESRRK